ncbi:type I polyketide synthase [Sorangium sp. So ce216]
MSKDTDPPAAPNLSPLRRAILSMEKMEARLAVLEAAKTEPIAIIGVGCRLPGGADSPAALWRILEDGVDAVGEVPASRWRAAETAQLPGMSAEQQRAMRWGGFVKDVDLFDARFFGVSPREASSLDPQQRLVMEVAWEALEHAGQAPDRLMGTVTGVFIGVTANDYKQVCAVAAPDAVDSYGITGSGYCFPSGRLSYFLGLQGPSVAVDTACSSSLVAVHLACQSLRSGESSLALAGGVNVMLSPRTAGLIAAMQALSPDGRCKTFDAQANGFVRGEGCGVVVLKRLSDALADGDTVLAVIRGSAVNQDGRSTGLTAPNVLSQQAMLRSALESARVSASELSYIETHGTGTPLGDPIEIEALTEVLGQPRPDGSACYLGALKTNLGHPEAAAGVAGLIKVVLALQHEAIPRNLHFTTLNPRISLEGTPFTIPTETVSWKAGDKRRIAGVSAFGLSGTNAHVIVEEAPPQPQPQPQPEAGPPGDAVYALPLSARSPEALRALAQSYRAFLADGAPGAALPLRDVAYTASVRRSHHEHRLALVGAGPAELLEQLAAFEAGESRAGLSLGHHQGARRKVVFVFPGQGSQWIGMGRTLLAREPAFADALARCDAALRPYTDASLLDELAADEARSRLHRIDVVQPALFAIEVALSALWRSWGVEPDAVVGHSMGEVAAAHVAGALSLDDAARIICRRSQLLLRVSGKGAMALVELPLHDAQRALAGFEDKLSVAVSNSPRSTVLSGDPDALEQLLLRLEKDQVFCRRVKVDVASHSPQMDPLAPELRQALHGLSPTHAKLLMHSTVTGQPNHGPDLTAEYWVNNLRAPVLFSSAVEQLLRTGHELFIEMSPHPILVPAIDEVVRHAGASGVALPSMRRNQHEPRVLLESLGGLYAAGHPVDWKRLYPSPARSIPLPTYPWQRERHWITDDMRSADAPRRLRVKEATGHPLLGAHLVLPTQMGTHFWQRELSVEELPYLADHRVQGDVVVPGTAYVEMALAASAEVYGAGTLVLEDVVFERILALPSGGARTITVTMVDEPGGASIEISSRQGGAGSASQDGWVRHAKGSLRRRQPAQTEPEAAQSTAPRQIQQRCPATLAGAELYRRMQERGLHHGESFQGVQQLWLGPSEVLGRVQLTEDIAAEAGAYQLHPTLLDACFQVLAALFMAQESTFKSGQTFVPVGVQQVRCDRKPGPEVWVHGALHAPEGEQRSLSGDLVLLDQDGQIIADIKGLRVQLLEAGADPRQEQLDWLYAMQWQRKDLAPSDAAAAPEPAPAGSWLLLSEREELGHSLASLLQARGESFVRVVTGDRFKRIEPTLAQVDPADPASFRSLLHDVFDGQPCRGVVHLWSAESVPAASATPATLDADQRLGTLGVLHLVQALLQHGWRDPPRLWLATRGAQPVGPAAGHVSVAQAPLWGLGRVIALEHPELQCTRLDLSPAHFADEAHSLLHELLRKESEDQVAFRPDGRYVARLTRGLPPQADAATSLPLAPAGERPFRVEIPAPGSLERLTLRQMQRRAPRPGEVEIEVDMASLSSMDVMKAMGTYPGLPDGPIPLGGECAGRISALGEGVQGLSLGQQVVAFTGSSLATHTLAPAHFVVPMPASLRPEQVSPAVFMTAWYGLYDLGRLRQGERVLIHSAAGGVGLAAIQLAQRVGAEVFATAGTDEKRELLRAMGIRYVMDSRSLRFADEIMDYTRGQGVDVVLNSLAGEAITKSMSCLAYDGRFLEIGKRDIYAHRPLDLAHFRKGLSYAAIDLAGLAERKPQLITSLLRQVVDELAAGRLSPLPCEVFPASSVADAFHSMAQGRHVGKIVVSMRQPDAPIAPQGGSSSLVHEHASYLVTGGLGGLGLSVAQWLVSKGARHLALSGRSAPSEHARAAIQAMELAGAQVRLFQADVSEHAQVDQMLRSLEQTMPPLRGVVHAAGILDDRTLLQLDADRFRRVMAPKMHGAWNLHALTADKPLDFFVLYSGAAALVGSPGQGNYAAGNAFMDALAHHRRAVGLHALSIAWGPFSEVGLAAAQQNRGERLSYRGMKSITPEQGLEILERLLSENVAHVGVMRLDVRQWLEFYPSAARSSFWSALRQEARRSSEKGPQGSQLRDTLSNAEPERRAELLERHLGEQLGRVLRLDPSRVDRLAAFGSFGLDSLMSLEVRNHLEASLGMKLSATLLFTYPNLAALSEYLLDKLELSDSSPDESQTREDEVRNELSENVERLDEDELLAFFNASLESIESERPR